MFWKAGNTRKESPCLPRMSGLLTLLPNPWGILACTQVSCKSVCEMGVKSCERLPHVFTSWLRFAFRKHVSTLLTYRSYFLDRGASFWRGWGYPKSYFFSYFFVTFLLLQNTYAQERLLDDYLSRHDRRYDWMEKQTHRGGLPVCKCAETHTERRKVNCVLAGGPIWHV